MLIQHLREMLSGLSVGDEMFVDYDTTQPAAMGPGFVVRAAGKRYSLARFRPGESVDDMLAREQDERHTLTPERLAEQFRAHYTSPPTGLLITSKAFKSAYGLSWPNGALTHHMKDARGFWVVLDENLPRPYFKFTFGNVPEN